MENQPEQTSANSSRLNKTLNFAEASLWILIPAAFGEIFVSSAVFLLGFWLHFGELAPFAWGFAAFLAVFQILLIVGLRFQNRTEVHTTVAAHGDWIDKIGALLGWICGQAAIGFPEYRQIFRIAEVVFTIILPLITMLPNARYISRNAAYIQVPILVFVTVLPMLVGIDALVELLNIANFYKL